MPLRIAAACLVTGIALAAQGQTPVFRTGTHTVSIPVSLRDQQGRIVTTLRSSDFEVLEDGVPVAIATFTNQPQPLTLLLLFDTSASGLGIADVRRAANAAVAGLADGDRARIGTMSSEVAISPHLTSDRATLSRVIREEIWPGFGSHVWDGMYAALRAQGREPGTRQTLIVLSDGRDTVADESRGRPGERRTVADVHGLARQEGWQIYAVTPFSSISGQLRAVVDDTGGRVVSAGRSSALPATFASVMEELRHQYLLGYVTDKKDGQVHTIDVRVRSGNYKVTSRRSYQAEGR